MAVHAPSTRRDRRYAIRPGAGVLEILPGSGRSEPIQGSITKISIAGLAFALDGPVADLEPGPELKAALVRIGDCVLEGEVAIRDVCPAGGERLEFGCVFVPAAQDVEARLMALVAGIAASPAE